MFYNDSTLTIYYIFILKFLISNLNCCKINIEGHLFAHVMYSNLFCFVTWYWQIPTCQLNLGF